ncbi:hypothetical protein CBF37_11265 [Vagococcus vulneris]|uniref:Uncharacterized protein n=1 Tax=Vagococcus vulneris TaxID=1977869 RepID=A0A429ZQQ1_9ENTE|nr:hypothetical protein CBF37_11265 [Vagococcus vulneris]
MKNYLTGTFTGKDGSLGFKNGQKYNFRTEVRDNVIWVICDNNLYCCYRNVESLLTNWIITHE